MNATRAAIVLIVASSASCAFARDYTEQERRVIQTELDARCESARERRLEPRRHVIYRECMRKRNDPEFCIHDALAYNGERIGGAPLHYDLPECVRAFEFQRSQRSAR